MSHDVNVECHMDPNIGKATIGKERTVATCKESLPTSRGPHRNRFEENMTRLKSKMKKIGGTIMSDGWQSTTSATWIATFVEGVTDKSTGLPLFSDLAWFTYKVSGVMCSVSVCEYCWSVEGWIHSQRRNRLDQKLVEKLVRTHTNLVMRESLDDTTPSITVGHRACHR